MKKYIMLIASLLLFATCSSDDLEKFDNNCYLYFENDVVSYTFAYSDASTTTYMIEIPVLLAGRYTSSEMTYAVEVDVETSTGVEGTDFTIPAGQTFAPGKESSILKVELKRTAKLLEDDLIITLRLVADENFLPGHIQTVSIIVSDRVIKPDWWVYSPYEAFIGTYTPTKLLLWFEYWGMDDGNDPLDDPQYYYYTDQGTGNYIYKVYRDGTVRSVAISFRGWLRNEKGNPIDPVTERYVSDGLGSQI